MLALGWIIVILIMAVVFIFVAGLLLFKYEENMAGMSALSMATGVILLALSTVLIYEKGIGQVASPTRLRPDQTYTVVGVVERGDGKRVVVLDDYEGRMFAVTVSSTELNVVKENISVSVDGPLVGGQYFVPFPRPRVITEDPTTINTDESK